MKYNYDCFQKHAKLNAVGLFLVFGFFFVAFGTVSIIVNYILFVRKVYYFKIYVSEFFGLSGLTFAFGLLLMLMYFFLIDAKELSYIKFTEVKKEKEKRINRKKSDTTIVDYENEEEVEKNNIEEEKSFYRACYCTKCGNKNSGGRKFCYHCGVPLRHV